ncbi:MAG: sugar transferase, partial [Candidatus Komeilibacteria bacterium]|nr:sugar transferase [Candidatus Komeilibacteria bacterium]
LNALRPAVFNITRMEYLRLLMLVALLWLPIFAVAGLYAIRANFRLVRELGRVILGCSTGLVGIVMFIFFRHELFGSRFLVLAGYFTSMAFVFFGRVAIRLIQRSLFKKGTGVLRLVVFGGEKTANNIVNYLQKDLASGLVVVRHFHKFDDAALGSLYNIARYSQADVVILADNSPSRDTRIFLWQFCQEHHLDFAYTADSFEAQSKNVELSTLGGVPLIQIKRTPLGGWGRIVKRIMDVFGSLLALLFIIPLSFIIGLFIKLDSPGPIFMKLLRVGEGRRTFMFYKFRSMFVGAHELKGELQGLNERTGPLFKMKNDPRVTRVGRVLRKWSLDELPNFFNVLKGDMSLVGPRPHEPEEVGRYTANQKRLLTIKPGITGLAQVSGRSDLDFNEEERLDIFYIENWNFWLDMQILLRTPWVVITGKNAA